MLVWVLHGAGEEIEKTLVNTDCEIITILDSLRHVYVSKHPDAEIEAVDLADHVGNPLELGDTPRDRATEMLTDRAPYLLVHKVISPETGDASYEPLCELPEEYDLPGVVPGGVGKKAKDKKSAKGKKK